MKKGLIQNSLLLGLFVCGLLVLSCQETTTASGGGIALPAEQASTSADPFASDPFFGDPSVFTNPTGVFPPLNIPFEPTIALPNPGVVVTPGAGESSAPQSFALNILAPRGASYNVSVSGSASQSCSGTCTISVEQGKSVTIRTVPSAPFIPELNRVAKVVQKAWGWSCANTAASSDCTLTMNSTHAVTSLMSEEVKFRYTNSSSSDNQERILTALRNPSQLYNAGIWNKSGWANEGCWQDDGVLTCAAVGITNDSASTNQFCATVGSGFVAEDVKSATPSWSGWANSGKSSRGYYNLSVARFTGSQWQSLCSDGRDCYNKRTPYISALTCSREL